MLNNLIRFVAGTKAKASEVNYNFDQVKQAVTELEDWKKNTEEKLNYSFFQIFDRVIKDHVLTGEEAKGLLLQGSLVTKFYPDAVAKIKEARETAVDTEFTYGDITFPYKLAANRWCIVDLQYKDKVDGLFNTTGIAEFYIWDNENEQFYLPRNNWFDQYTNDPEQVNKFNEAGLPNIKTSGAVYSGSTNQYHGFLTDGGCIYSEELGIISTGGSSGSDNAIGVNFDASLSNSIYGKSNTVQPPSSNKLLYFVVGNTYVNQEDIDIAQVESDLNNKLNIDHSNDLKPYIKTMMDNGNGNGYIIYSNGYAVQYGHYQVSSVASIEITFYKQFKNTNYIFNRSPIWITGAIVGSDNYAVGCEVKETTKVSILTHIGDAVSSIDWVATGYLAEGEY